MRARTYNQNHVARAHTGGRRISIYWTWSYPWEANRDVTQLDNRFSTMTEVRRVAWPKYETWFIAASSGPTTGMSTSSRATLTPGS